MPNTWQPRDAKKFARQLKLNTPYYFVYNIAQNMAPYEDAQLYSEITFTKRHFLTGTPCTDMGTDAETVCLTHGPMLDAPPRGMRNIADPAPQVAAPLGSNDYEGVLDEAELRGLEKQVAQGSNPSNRRRLGSWRV